ncbi:MAG: HepT-like ribonuclease domain-containing protein [Tepidisphaeraceae bacterium]
MLASARRCLDLTAGIAREAFLADPLRQDVVLYRLSVIGEAARYVTDPTRTATPEVPWPKIKRMRNVLLHDYWNVNTEIVWDTVSVHLPTFVGAVERVLASGTPVAPPEP